MGPDILHNLRLRSASHRCALRLLALVAVVPLTTATAAQAQERVTVAPTEAQVRLINQGAQADKKGRFDDAIRAYESALKLGELDVIYLNLGRAWQKKNECFQAHDAFRQAATAPHAEGVPVETIQEKLARFDQELRQTCPGRLTLACDPGVESPTVDGQPQACGEVRAWPPGAYTVVATLDGRPLRRLATVAALEDLTLDLRAVQAQEDPTLGGLFVACSPANLQVSIGERPIPCNQLVQLAPGLHTLVGVQGERRATRDVTIVASSLQEVELSTDTLWDHPGPLSLMALGGGLLLGGGVLGVLVEQTNDDIQREADEPVVDASRANDLTERVDLLEALEFSALGLGALTLTGGLVWLWLDADTDQDAPLTLAPWIKPDLAGVAIGGGW